MTAASVSSSSLSFHLQVWTLSFIPQFVSYQTEHTYLFIRADPCDNSQNVSCVCHEVSRQNAANASCTTGQFDVHVTVHRVKFLLIKPTRCDHFSNLFLELNPICFGQFLCPSSEVFHCTHSSGICHTGLQTVPILQCMNQSEHNYI